MPDICVSSRWLLLEDFWIKHSKCKVTWLSFILQCILVHYELICISSRNEISLVLLHLMMNYCQSLFFMRVTVIKSSSVIMCDAQVSMYTIIHSFVLWWEVWQIKRKFCFRIRDQGTFKGFLKRKVHTVPFVIFSSLASLTSATKLGGSILQAITTLNATSFML